MSKLPQFETLDELVEFWETHDFTDYIDEMEEVSLASLKAETTLLQIPLDPEQLAELERLAIRRGLTVNRLARGWIEDRLRQEVV
jgi:predicted amino acid dehydrogenase